MHLYAGVSMLLVHAACHVLCFMTTAHVQAACSLHVHAAFRCRMSMFDIYAACPCCMFLLCVHTAYSYCMPMLLVQAMYVSMLLVHHACQFDCRFCCQCCMSLYMSLCVSCSLSLLRVQMFIVKNTTPIERELE
jgi:hypothetical protein